MNERKPIGREVLVNGYLRKAPSSLQRTKNQGLNIFCTGCNVLLEPRWKKRFCIFYKIRNATETQVFFEYFSKESDKSPRGCVDLNSCDCIYEQKVGNQLPNVFVVQTTYRGKRRDYLFSANTPEEMNEWIAQLTKVLHMVPEQVSNPAASEMIRRNGNSLSYFSSSREVSITSKIPPYSKNSSQLLENSYVDRGLTEEYRTSFGEAPADDDDCYHILPQPDHPYVNLKANGSATADTSAVAGETPFLNGQDRPDSVYFNVWDSSTVDFKAVESKFEYHNAPVLAKSDKISPEVSNSKPPLKSSTATAADAGAKEPSIVNEIQLPKRCRNTSSSSSSDDSTEDEEVTAESSVDRCAKEPSTFIPLDGAGEAEAAASSPSEVTLPLSNAIKEKSNTKPKSTPDTMTGPGIQYLDAENLDFSLRQRVANGAPLVPPKPVHLRRNAPKEANSEGASTNTATKPSTSNNEEDHNPSGYSELDVRRTKALFMVTKKIFGEDDDTA
nr:GRB2 associated binding protein 3 [Hymenolepis microstoma]